MLPGARQFFERRGGGGGWQNPYVTDGLVAMWDGEWNAGGGVHDDAPSEIADIVGSSPLTISNTYYVEIGSRYFQPDASHGGTTVNLTTDVLKNALDANSATIEICASFASIQNGEWFSVDDATRLYNSAGLCPYWLRVGGSLANVSSLSQSLDTLVTIAIRIGGGGSAIFLNGVSQFAISKGTSIIPVGIRVARNMIGMRVHCFRISTALTDAQIAANYSVDQQRFNLP